MKLPVIFSQKGEDWQGIKLGGSGVTIGDYGCLITCYAMVLRYYGWQTDPKMLNALLMKSKGFDAGGNLYWGSLPDIYGGKQTIVDARNRALTDAETLAMINAIKAGKPVIIQVDMIPATSKADMHFVVGTEYDSANDDILIADPWTGKQSSLRKLYGAQGTWAIKRAVYRYVIFEPIPKDGTPVPTPKPTVPATDFEAKYTKLKGEYDLLEREVETLKGDLKEAESDLEKAQKKLSKIKDIL